MFYSPILLAEKYNYLEEKFQLGYEFLRKEDLEQLPDGSNDLGNGVVAYIQSYKTIEPSEGKYETHDCYFDIQYVVRGQEMMGVVSRDGLIVSEPYDSKRDITFYNEPKMLGQVLLKAGDLVIVAPEDAHCPRLVAGETSDVKKVVIKIPVS